MTTTEVSAADQAAGAVLTQRLLAAWVHQDAAQSLPVPAAITPSA